jgi:hypothetical protein
MIPLPQDPFVEGRRTKSPFAPTFRFSWVAIGAAAVTAVGGIISSKQAKKGAGQTASPINIGDTAQQSIAANTQNEPEIEALLRQSNAFTQNQNLSLLNKAIPGYSSIAGNLSKQAQEASADPYALPKDFTDNLTRLAAERGINTGVRGQANDFSLLRDFGVNSLQYGNQRIQQSQGILQTLAGLAKVNPLSPLSFYATPQQSLAAATGNQSLAQSGINAQNQANLYASQNEWSSFSRLAGTAAGAWNSYNSGAGDSGGGISLGQNASNQAASQANQNALVNYPGG